MSSTTTTPTTYLITGTTRGIGKGLVASLLLRPNTTIIACVRDPLAPAAQILHNLPRCAEGSSKLIVVKLDSTQDSDAKNVVEEIQTVCIYLTYLTYLRYIPKVTYLPCIRKDNLISYIPIPFDEQQQKKDHLTNPLLSLQTHSITHLDHVFANAGILPPESLTPTSSLDISWIRQSLEINTIAPILLYQATKPLLDRAENPKFVVSTLPIPSACHIYRRYINLHDLIQQTCR